MKKRFFFLVAILAAFVAIPFLQAHAISELTYFSARIGASPAVYSGPGKEYYRANSGKAQYGRGGVARIYGLASNGWMMVGYELGSGDYRIGYVAPKNADLLYDVEECNTSIPRLKLDSVPATITRTCDLTDDPVIHTKPIAELKKGTAVTYLATHGNWAYIEADSSIGLVRAFVRKEYVSTSGGGSPGPVATGQPSGSWRTLYRQYLQVNGSNNWLMLRLMDLDFDGTPELLITTDRAHAGTIIRVLAIRGGKVVTSELTIMEMDGNSEWSYPADLMLFYNSGTSQHEWLVFDGYVMGDYESYSVNLLTFANGQAWLSELFRHERRGNEHTNAVAHTYYTGGQMVSKATYDSRISTFRSQIQPADYNTAVYDLLIGDRSLLSAFEQIAQEYQ